jgi:hypothetical protein
MFLIALALAATQAAPALRAEPAPPAEAVPQPMTVEVVRDAINDRLRATATLRVDGERIEIRCREPDWGDVSVQYHSRHWIARGNFFSGQEPVTYRFDDHAPIRRLWRVHDRTARFDDRGRVIAFVGALMGARQLVLRTRDIENHSFDAIFPIGETQPAIVELLHTCGSHRINPALIGKQ